MRIRAGSRHLAKAGNAEAEYEDAVWPDSAEREARLFRCAIADGATETSFSGLWARMLVRAYGTGRLADRDGFRALNALQSNWRRQVAERPLPWYAEEKVRQGAFSALLGLTIAHRRDGSIRWRAMAIGDCCLMRLPLAGPGESFPFISPQEFTSRPRLLSTNPRSNEPVDGLVTRMTGDAARGDRFYLMSDALAAWYLQQSTEGRCPAQMLEAALTDEPSSFARWVCALRRSGEMRNDDVTLLAIHIC